MQGWLRHQQILQNPPTTRIGLGFS
jgi:hypothetical protein